MKNKLQLIVIGDNSVLESVYQAFSNPNTQQENINPPMDGSKDHANLLTNAKFTVDGKEINYDIIKYEDFIQVQNDNRPHWSAEYLTVVVCIDEKRRNWEETRFYQTINHINKKRTEKKPYNIIPMIITNDKKTSDLQDNQVYKFLKTSKFYYLCRDIIVINSNNPNYCQHLSSTLDITLATPIYNEVLKCIEHLYKLELILNNNEIYKDNMDNISKVLKNSLISITKARAFNVQEEFQSFLKPPSKTDYKKDSVTAHLLKTTEKFYSNATQTLRDYFKYNRNKLSNDFFYIKQKLDASEKPTKTYAGRIFLNILCSIAAIFASLSIVGIPLVYYTLSQNSRYHNNYLKFFATNEIDEKRASIVKIEDEINNIALKAH